MARVGGWWLAAAAAAACAAVAVLAGALHSAGALPDTSPPEPRTAPQTWTRTVDFEQGLDGFDGTSVANGRIEVDLAPLAPGQRAARAVYDGGGGNGYARGHHRVRWREGERVVYALDLYLPEGTVARLAGPVDILRWDNWTLDERTTDHGGVTLDARGEVSLFHERLGGGGVDVLLGPLPVPEGRWFRIEVEQRLHAEDGRASNRLWVDGRWVGWSDQANTSGRPVTTVRSGIVSVAAGSQVEPVELWFDEVRVGRR